MSAAVDVSELEGLLTRLADGLDRFPAAEARRTIDFWRQRVDAGRTVEHRRLAEALDMLESQLSTTDPGPGLGSHYAALGERVLAAAPLAGDDGQLLVERIGNYLFHAGHAMRGVGPA